MVSLSNHGYDHHSHNPSESNDSRRFPDRRVTAATRPHSGGFAEDRIFLCYTVFFHYSEFRRIPDPPPKADQAQEWQHNGNMPLMQSIEEFLD